MKAIAFPYSPVWIDRRFNLTGFKMSRLNQIRGKSAPSGNFVLPLRAIG
ncbi:hypothetical protein NEISICOT_02566 [Neisseria sicca ATCC 29256]|uniref:Uncharacterized protein n=2 Tax=Neisseria TaxID=482 RepID=A0AA36UIJ1_9NEIS|nr:hypothetical protein NEISICOT_02566 [Neisseria sicca ATCC 29256]EGQ76601.1 hypothetical protein HMPREF9418_1784 [Neisseria macacae ATCC 33926]